MATTQPASIWTHPSVLTLLREESGAPPQDTIATRARELALQAMEKGWTGPPFDPLELAERLGVATVANEEVPDARLVPGKQPRIEFNPNRPAARVRFSIAHELAHQLFSDHAEQIRNRKTPATGDDWQLELLCNIGAAELLMPAGAFPEDRVDDLSLAHLLDLRATFGVSTEAVLRRAVRLTSKHAAMFAATRTDDGTRIDYTVPSTAWDAPRRAGSEIAGESVLRRCTAIGFTVDGDESWAGQAVHVQAVGVPPYPGHSFPRIVGIVQPLSTVDVETGRFRYERGDATEPQPGSRTIIAHIVNDRARQWGTRGFAAALAAKQPEARSDFEEWAKRPGKLQLGHIHWWAGRSNALVASMVAQSGFGEDRRPRVKLRALAHCLAALASLAREHEARIQMPLIGTGQGGMEWPAVRDLVVDSVCRAGIRVTVYVLPHARMPNETSNISAPVQHQLL